MSQLDDAFAARNARLEKMGQQPEFRAAKHQLGLDAPDQAPAQAPVSSEPQVTPAQRAQQLLMARNGQQSGDRVEQQMAEYNQANQGPSVGRRIAVGLQNAGAMAQGQTPMAGLQPQVQVHPETYAKFSQWLENFKKTGGQG